MNSATLRGVEALPVTVEVVVSRGLPAFNIVGMPDAAIREATERIKAALRSCGFEMPGDKVVINLAPGSLKKSGAGFDLPIAVALLAATGQIPTASLEEYLFVGELSLQGCVRTVPGLLAYALAAKEGGLKLLCADSPGSLVRIDGLEQFCAANLSCFRQCDFPSARLRDRTGLSEAPDFSEIAGHDVVKRALQIAAAGEHGVLMMGPPGSGKTMLASRLPSILPPLSESEIMEAAVAHSIAGEDIDSILCGIRPFRQPHHSASLAGLVGGGTVPSPGEISLAHCGVLFLDELSEFSPHVLQSIRQPLESGCVTVTRADGNVTFPSRFSLVAASNPCPCGFYGDREHACRCTVSQVQAYRNRIGGPILDRIDLHVNVQRIDVHDVLSTGCGSSSLLLREGVLTAREFRSWRLAKAGIDGKPDTRQLVELCGLSDKDRIFFEEACSVEHMSGRGVIRTLSVARTIADIGESPCVSKEHLCEALHYRRREDVDGF